MTTYRSTYIGRSTWARQRFMNVWSARLRRNAWWMHGLAGAAACCIGAALAVIMIFGS